MNKQRGEWFRVSVRDSQKNVQWTYQVYSLDTDGAFNAALHRLGGVGLPPRARHGRLPLEGYLPMQSNNFKPRYSLRVNRMLEQRKTA